MTLVDMSVLTVTIPEQATLNVVAFCTPPGTKPEPVGPAKPVTEPVRLPFNGTVFNMTIALERGAPLGLELPPRFRLRIVVT